MINKLGAIYNILKRYIFPWWQSQEKKIAWGGLIALLVMSLISVYIAVIFTDWSRYFYNAIEKKDLATFIHEVCVFVPLVSILLFDFCSRTYLTAWLSFRWRRWGTEQLQKKWLSHKNFYKISLQKKEVDNPDQRIAQDISVVCYTAIDLFLAFFRDGVNFITFAIILWNLSRAFVFKLGSHNLTFPGLLVWAAIAYSLIGTVVIFKIGGPIIDLNRLQEKKEADFRYRLMRIFERREEIATLSGEEAELLGLQETFGALTRNYYEVLKRQIYINFFDNFYMNASMFVPLFLVGPLYFKSLITMGVLMQIQQIFFQVKNSLSSIVLQFQTIAGGIASLQRLIAFNTLMEKDNYQVTYLPKEEEKLHIPSLTIRTPQQKKIWTSPEVVLKIGDRKVLMAPSGTGKTSFLRVISGIYPYVDGGEISINKDTMIIPQRPYMPIGTLRECISYPSLGLMDPEQIIFLMKQTQLDHLIPLLDEVHDYQNRLSLGEQQRINFVRILLHQPKWLFMDEPIAQLHKESSIAIFKLVTKSLSKSGIFIVSHQEIEGFEKIKLTPL
ncbi:MAG: ATP-binding cassette domain-containing protein [Chthoniobacterales bacterium]|nr:ATP-binding cassette domain-containing protein [Chthoniobacterales bacterium]